MLSQRLSSAVRDQLPPGAHICIIEYDFPGLLLQQPWRVECNEVEKQQNISRCDLDGKKQTIKHLTECQSLIIVYAYALAGNLGRGRLEQHFIRVV